MDKGECPRCNGSGVDPTPRAEHHPSCDGNCGSLCPIAVQEACEMCNGTGERKYDLEEIIGQSIGEASMLWEETPKSILGNTKAVELMNRTLDAILKHLDDNGWVRDEVTNDWQYYMAYFTDEDIATPKGVHDWIQKNLLIEEKQRKER